MYDKNMGSRLSHSFSNREIAKILADISAAYEVKNESKFKIMAYQKAAVSVEHATSELKDLWDDGKLDQIPGIGKNISSYLDELFRTGQVRHFNRIKKGLPPAMFVFLDIPGVGPKTAYALAKILKISNKGAVKKLKEAALAGKIKVMENFGEKSEEDIIEGIKALEKGEMKTKRMLLPYADMLASDIINYLKRSPEVLEAHPLGSLRRMVATIGDIDISVCTKKPHEVMEYFLKYKKIKTVLEKGEKALLRVILLSGQQVDVRFSLPESYGAMLQYFTGSKQHNIQLREFSLRKGMSLSEYGIKKVQSSISKKFPGRGKFKVQSDNLKVKSFEDEEGFYHELGLEWIPPELREARGEIEASRTRKLPKLVELKDIKGDLHVHSDFPIEPSHDLGESDPKAMVEEAERLGYEYLGFSEHNPSSSKHTETQVIDLLKRKEEAFEQLRYSAGESRKSRVQKLPINILNGLEVDIKPDGELSISEKCLDLLDFVIASIHTNFGLNREKMTKRVLKALAHPKIKIFGHPTGRLLEEREGYELDWEAVFDFCLKNKKILEISAWPNRLDLPDVLVREAVKLGVKLIIDSDSHHVDQMKLMKYGVSVARRGWAEKEDIINTLSYKELSDILLK